MVGGSDTARAEKKRDRQGKERGRFPRVRARQLTDHLAARQCRERSRRNSQCQSQISKVNEQPLRRGMSVLQRVKTSARLIGVDFVGGKLLRDRVEPLFVGRDFCPWRNPIRHCEQDRRRDQQERRNDQAPPHQQNARATLPRSSHPPASRVRSRRGSAPLQAPPCSRGPPPSPPDGRFRPPRRLQRTRRGYWFSSSPVRR